MSNKLKNGSNCAACVLYPETESHCWILTKVEKKLPGNRFLVRDEFADDPQFETYQVDSNHITPFPSSNEEYKPDEKVLALWHDDERNEWSTMFYNAEVKSVHPTYVSLLYSQTDFEVNVEKNKLAKYPPKFQEMAEEVDENETSQNQTASTTAQITEDVTDDGKSEEANENSNTQTVDEDSGKSSEQLSEDKGTSKTSEDESQSVKQETENVSESASEKVVKEESRSEDEPRPHPGRHGRGGHSHAPRAPPPKQPTTPAENRRIKFMFQQPEVQETPKPNYLSNEDFSKLSGDRKELERMKTEPGTPLLDSLNDAELFDQEEMLHVTGSGIISVANVDECKKSGLAEGKMPCGRLGRIINEWIKNPME